MPVIISELFQTDLIAYRTFLSRGLRDDEQHFRITPDDDKDATFPTDGKPDSFTLLATVDGDWAGVVSFARSGKDRKKLRHKGLLFRMYVPAAFRGRGIAGLLIEAVIARARRLPDMEAINLTVIAANTTATAIYSRMGFAQYGLEERAIKWRGQYFDEALMALQLV